MGFLQYMLLRSWQWIADNGLAIASLTILLILVPRIRRLVIAVAESNMSTAGEHSKGRRALIGAIVYIVEVIAYFVLILAILSKFGISLSAAAIPATVVSAAVGFGAQSVIADFLGGLFIVAEKQYGIDDWVEFHSPSGTVQGDVVNMTLRATTIRTLNGEEVIVPNSEARMCINYSSQWSRAVVEVPVPMTAGGSIKDLEQRTVAAAEAAIALDSVRDSVLSDIQLQSSTALNPPTVMGLPWTVTMRLVVDCKPGDQWLIERAIRASVIDTWWDDYGERAQKTPFDAAEQVTGHVRDEAMIEQLRAAENNTTNSDSTRTATLPSAGNSSPRQSDIPQTDANQTVANPDDAQHEDVSPVADQDRTAWSTLSRREKIRRVFSAGGRARVSTIVLLVTLVILGILNLMTVDNEDGPSGWLAPSRWSAATTDEETSAETEPTSPQQDSETTPTQQAPDPKSDTDRAHDEETQNQQNQKPSSVQHAPADQQGQSSSQPQQPSQTPESSPTEPDQPHSSNNEADNSRPADSTALREPSPHTRQ